MCVLTVNKSLDLCCETVGKLQGSSEEGVKLSHTGFGLRLPHCCSHLICSPYQNDGSLQTAVFKGCFVSYVNILNSSVRLLGKVPFPLLCFLNFLSLSCLTHVAGVISHRQCRHTNQDQAFSTQERTGTEIQSLASLQMMQAFFFSTILIELLESGFLR